MAQKKKYRRALILSGGGARGAYQVGVWKFLLEMGWKPDLICGTSVGAINATAIGCGMNLEELIQLWKTIERGRVFRISILRQILHVLMRRGFTPFFDTAPLKQLLHERMDVPMLRHSPHEIVITAVNILTSEIKFFNQDVIDIEHVMASSAIPLLFPWQYIDGEPHWDGGVMMNNPILPALERGCREIIVVLLSPVGGSRLPLPRNRRDAIERVFEQQLIGSYEAFLAHLAWDYKLRQEQNFLRNWTRRAWNLNDLRLVTVAPQRMLGFHSILNFSNRQADNLIREGFIDAKNQLASFFDMKDEPY
ncbi:MAG: patatin-like phospholipase family protein [Leptospiraceae bacterium]|nr:patatin-like phospholipase family protein [Leptospiraceae bacterium]MCB1315066.1 patatin-like phospholipase family protein [Leptospiraceae bacterium]MCB1322050.1 patatin-like phospholipase family protein [Leptospiraceae bacterium]